MTSCQDDIVYSSSMLTDDVFTYAWRPSYDDRVTLHDVYVYMRPDSKAFKDARFIWDACGFQDTEYAGNLIRGLERWVLETCEFTKDTNGGIARLVWKPPPGNNRYTWTWSVFLKWFEIACGNPQHFVSSINTTYFM